MTPDVDFAAVRSAIEAVARDEVKAKLGVLSRAEVTEKSAGDFVTTADLAVERRLGALLKDILPAADVLGEEAVSAGQASIGSLAEDRLPGSQAVGEAVVGVEMGVEAGSEGRAEAGAEVEAEVKTGWEDEGAASSSSSGGAPVPWPEPAGGEWGPSRGRTTVPVWPRSVTWGDWEGTIKTRRTAAADTIMARVRFTFMELLHPGVPCRR